MKAGRIGVLDRDVVSGDAVPLERERVKIRAIDEDYFRVEMEPGVGGLQGASTVDAATLSYTFEDFPAAATTIRRRTRKARALWAGCGIRLNLWYTSPVGSANLFTLGFNYRPADAGASLAGTPTPANVTFTAPGPAVANDVLFITVVAPGKIILPGRRVAQFSFRRTGPDANPNDFRFVFAEFVMEESA